MASLMSSCGALIFYGAQPNDSCMIFVRRTDDEFEPMMLYLKVYYRTGSLINLSPFGLSKVDDLTFLVGNSRGFDVCFVVRS